MKSIAFAKPENPTQDQCDQCLNYDKHKADAPAGHDAETCSTCNDSAVHAEKTRKAREAYQKDMESENCFSVDMQKVMLIPKLTSKEHIFVSRIVCFNETFGSGRRDRPNFAVLWHEGLSARKASDVASSYVKFLVKSECSDPILWCDNCSGQNKNWTLYTALVTAVNSDWGPESITLKYLEKGHTFMGADSIHGVISKKMKKCSEIVTFPDLVDVVDSAGKYIKPVVMEVSDFYQFQAGNRARVSKKVTLPKLADIVEVRFVKGSRLFLYRRAFDEETYEGVDFLRPKFSVEDMPKKHEKPRGITEKKQSGILKLLGHVAPVKRKFYLDMSINNSAKDLVVCNDDDA